MWKIIQILLILCIIKLGASQENEMLDGTSDIDYYDCNPASSTTVKKVTIGPCLNTPGCEIPNCCGIVSGEWTNISLTYTASIPMTTGTTHGYLTAVGIGSSKNQLAIPLPVYAQVPNAVVSYDANSCAHTTCPQVVGNKYRFDGIFTIPTTAVETFGLIAHFVAQVTSNTDNSQVFCKAIYAKIVNPNLMNSVTSEVTSLVTSILNV